MFERLARLYGNEKPSAREKLPTRVLGIDLGTTNSTVAEWVLPSTQANASEPKCISVDQPTMQGRYSHILLPSIVAIYEGKTWVGQGAKLLRSSAGLEEYKNLFIECKNDMGTKRTYHRAPTGFRSAKAIASSILSFLSHAATEDDKTTITSTVVTVPASFQAAQRSDTVDAAQRAGIELGQNGLLDEPMAAFLAYVCDESLNSTAEDTFKDLTRPQNTVVFDFGGGTCDVAVLTLGQSSEGALTVTPLSVSRYHRLGGGDIDRAIVHQVLLPQLMEQNKLDKFSLSFKEKRQFVQPAFLTIAEALKQNLCMEIDRLMRMGKWATSDKSQVMQKIPIVQEVAVQDRRLTLHRPQLSAAQFEEILKPFLSRDLLYPREDEYRLTCSIFAPISDALLRANLDPREINLCLLAGGSSLIPQVQEAVAQFFCRAKILKFSTRDDTQASVARGAAIHAMGLALYGKAPIQCVCHDDICFKTQSGPVVLIPHGEVLPFPRNEYARRGGFAVPETDERGEAQIRVEIVAGREQRPLFTGIWNIEAPVRKGEALWLTYRYDENQVLHLEMSREGENNQKSFHAYVENPLTHVVNPNETRVKIDEIEEKLRTGQIPREQIGASLAEVAGLYRQLGQNEKALDYYSRAIQAEGEPSSGILNRMATCANDLGDRQRAEQLYAEAARVDPWSGTYFNWSHAKEAWGETRQAFELVNRALEMDFDPAYLVLKARLEQKLRNQPEADSLLEQAREGFGDPESLDLFGLSWLLTLARMVSDDQLIKQVNEIMARKKAENEHRVVRGGCLPDLDGESEGKTR